MKNDLKKNDLLLWSVIIVILWFMISWYWYVCGIKNFCSAPANHKVTVSAAKAIPVEDRDNERDKLINRKKKVATNRKKVTEEVVIECNSYLNSYIRFGYNNNSADVRKLETYFNKYEDEDLTVDGVFSKKDEDAVKRFQKKYKAQVMDPWGMTTPSGYVYKTTRDQINTLQCAYEFAKNNQ